MEIIRIESKDLEKQLHVGDKIVALSGYTLPEPYEVISLHPGRALVKNLEYPQLGEDNLFYSANASVMVEREEENGED